MNYKKISKIISGTLLCTMCLYQVPVLAYTKDETVYTKINTSSEQYETIVSNHLKNTENEELIKDMTNLFNIKNTNGDETFNQEGNSIIWNANKNDIYYQGESDKKLPIEVNITYKLDGKEMKASEIVGKSGKVTVLISYKNKDEHIVNINGKNEKLYTPFVVVAGTIIDNTKNKNITITNGKVIDDGSRTVVLGMALPGLQESIGLDKKTIDIPSEIEINMDAIDFEMNSIMSFVTPKVIEEDSINIFDDVEKIYNKVGTLQTSSKKIEEGANNLKDGTTKYCEKSKEFNSAMEKITEGMSNANSNYTKINDGIKTLKSSSSELNNGAKQVTEGIAQIETNLNVVNKKLNEILEGGKSLESGEKDIIKGLDTIIEKLNQIPNIDNTNKINQLQKLVQANNTAIVSLKNENNKLQTEINKLEDEAQKETLKIQIASNNNIIELLNNNIQAENTTIESLKATGNTAIEELKLGLKQIKTGLNDLVVGTDKLNTGVSTLENGTITLEKKTGELNVGANKLYGGTQKISVATENLKNGSEEMKNGLNTLDNSGNQLLQANSQLTDGATTLNEGAKTLADGITQFNKDGILKICNYINGNIKNVTSRVEKLVELSNEYNNFTMIDEGVNGNVKFVMIIDSLKKQEEQEQLTEKVIIDESQNKNKLESH